MAFIAFSWPGSMLFSYLAMKESLYSSIINAISWTHLPEINMNVVHQIINAQHAVYVGYVIGMGVSGCRVGVSMAEYYLDLSDAEALFEEVRGKTMPKGAYGFFFNAAFGNNSLHGLIDSISLHITVACLTVSMKHVGLGNRR